MEGSRRLYLAQMRLSLYLHQEAVEGKCLETNLFGIFVNMAQMLCLMGLASWGFSGLQAWVVRAWLCDRMLGLCLTLTSASVVHTTREEASQNITALQM